jgi:putative PEP-CTERM system TPR-repeat lipoprotein
MVLNSGRRWRRAFLGSALAGALLASDNAFSDVPPLSHTQRNPNAGDGAAVDKLLADAQKALKGGDIRLALIYLKNAVSAAPQNAAARVQLGIVLLQYGDALAAERELARARKDGAPELLVLPPLFQAMLDRNESQLLLDLFAEPAPDSNSPAAADILKARALALQNLGRATEAIAAMDRSLKLRRDGPGLLTRARLSLQQGNFSAGNNFVDEAIQKSPDSPNATLYKIEMLFAFNDNSTALNLANQIVSKFPDSLPSRLVRIEAFLRLNQDAKAKTEIDDILAQKPDLDLATYYRALLIARAGDPKRAWGLAQALPPEFLDAHPGKATTVSYIAESAGHIESGASILARILKSNPDRLAVRIRLAEIRLQQNSPNDALNILRPVQDSTNPQVVALLSRIYLRMQRPADALDTLRRLDAGDRGSAAAKRDIALLELQMGNTDKAITDITQAVTKEPANPSIVAPLINALVEGHLFSEALAVADRLGSDPKRRVEALVYRGNILTLQHDAVGARAAFDKAIKMDPGNNAALYSRASLLESMQKYVEANRDLRTILSLDRKNLAALMKLADIAVHEGEDQNVRNLLGQAIALSPRDAAPRVTLVRYLVSRQDLKGALTATNDCLRAQPDNADCVALLGQVQSALGQKREAATSFRRLAALRPTDASTQLLLSAALALAGDRAGAGRALDVAVKLAPAAPDVKRAQINLQFDQGNANAAVALARSFQASNPGTDADLLLADTLQQAMHPDQAAAVLNKSLSDRPNRTIFMRLFRLAILMKDRKRAGDLISNWLVRNPDDGGARLEYATILIQQGDKTKAISQYQMVLRWNPNNVAALNDLGWLIQRSDPKRALSLLTLAWKLAPESANVADTLGWLKIRQKNAAGGLSLLNRAHALQPQDGEITYHLVVALDANSKRDAARGLLKSLLASGVKFDDQAAAVHLSSAWH